MVFVPQGVSAVSIASCCDCDWSDFAQGQSGFYVEMLYFSARIEGGCNEGHHYLEKGWVMFWVTGADCLG